MTAPTLVGPPGHELEVAHRQAARQQREHRHQPARTAGAVDAPVELVVPARLRIGVGRGRNDSWIARSSTSSASVSDVAARLAASPATSPKMR